MHFVLFIRNPYLKIVFKRFLVENIKRFVLKNKELQLQNTPFEEYNIEMSSIFVKSFVSSKQDSVRKLNFSKQLIISLVAL